MPLHFIAHGSDLDGQIAMAECRVCGYDIWLDYDRPFYMKIEGDDIIIKHVDCQTVQLAATPSMRSD